MDLYFLRHGLAGERTSPSEEHDSKRRLTKEGGRKMKRAAEGMKATGYAFDLVLSSPYARARETAEIVAGVFGRENRLRLTLTLTPAGNPEELIEELTRKHRARKRVLLVGHEPHLSRLVAVLVSGGTELALNFRKGGLCKVSAEHLRFGRCGTLEWLLTARQLRKLG